MGVLLVFFLLWVGSGPVWARYLSAWGGRTCDCEPTIGPVHFRADIGPSALCIVGLVGS